MFIYVRTHYFSFILHFTVEDRKIQGPIDIASLHWPDGIWECRVVSIVPRFHAGTRLMFKHDTAKWIMKYDYTSKITAALDARGLREQRRERCTRIYLYTPDTLNTGVYIKSRMDLKSSLSSSSRRVINFSERQARSSAIINYRLTIVLRDRVADSSRRLRRRALITRAKRADPRLLTFGETVNVVYQRECRTPSLLTAQSSAQSQRAAPPSMDTHACARVRYRRGLSRYWMADSWSSVTRERRNREEKCAGRGTTSLSFTLWR